MNSNTKAVANYFINKGLERGKPITLMQLMKLVYFAQGWSLAIYDKPLVPEKVEAWPFGPVIPTLYKTARRFGNSEIMATLAWNESEDILAVDNEKPLLAFVWKTYGDLSAYQMSALTHKDGTPWTRVWSSGGRESKNLEIPPRYIKDHFKEILKKYQDSLLG